MFIAAPRSSHPRVRTLGPVAGILAAMAACRSFGGAAEVDFPIEIGGRIILIQTTVNGAGPFPFILDTGATETVITPPTARQAGVIGKTERPVPGKAIARSVAVGQVAVANVPVLVVDPPQALALRLDKGINYGGILGYTFLAPYVTTIDYRRRRVGFAPVEKAGGAGPAEQAGAIKVSFVLRDRLIHAPVFVNGRGPLTFLIDSGSAEILLLPRAQEALRLSSSGERPDGIRFVTLDRVTLGGAEVRDLPAIVQRPPQEAAAGLTYDGILGYPFLSRFKVTYNYRDRILTLTPNIPADGQPSVQP